MVAATRRVCAGSYLRLFVWMTVALSAVSCSSLRTNTSVYKTVRKELEKNEFENVARKFASLQGKFSKKDRLLYALDAGFAYHYARQYDSSTAYLVKAEQAAEELFSRSITRAAASLLLNDNVLAYSGEDYEILYANLFMALNHLARREFDRAFVEVRRANEKLQVMQEKYGTAAKQLEKAEPPNGRIPYELPSQHFSNDALARYLSLHMYAADGSYDDARIDQDALRQAFVTQPRIYDFDPPPVLYASEEAAVLSVVAMTGMGPVKEALSLRVRTDKDLNLVQVLYDGPDKKDVEYGHFALDVKEDYYFKFAVPVIKTVPSAVKRIEVNVDGQVVGNMSLIENVSNVARETFEMRKTLTYVRSVARALAKGLASHKAKKKVKEKGVAGWLKKAAVDAAVEVSEAADLRCARLLPGLIWVGDFEVPPGRHDIRIEFQDDNGNRIGSYLIPEYRVNQDDFNVVEAFSFN